MAISLGIPSLERPISGGLISRTKDPLSLWLMYTLIMLVMLSVTVLRSMVEGVSTDTSYISAAIVLAFMLAFIFSFRTAQSLQREWRGINRLSLLDKTTVPQSRAEELALTIINHPNREQIRIKDLVDSYFSSSEVPLRTLSIFAGLMVTLGLIGTILGLIISVAGLEVIMQNVGVAGTGLMAGIQETIKGMAIAFYSTLFGAILGAVVLRMLSVSLSNSLVRMTCGLFDYLELLPSDAPPTTQQINVEVNHNLSQLSSAAADAERELRNFTAASLDARLATIASQLEATLAALQDTRK
ncbi:MAG: hypothetical protein ACK5GN_15185 [Pseudomonadota bacterium]|jgi:hypothetical protein